MSCSSVDSVSVRDVEGRRHKHGYSTSLSASLIENSQTRLAGWLQKRGDGRRKGWNRRYFVVDLDAKPAPSMTYFKSQKVSLKSPSKPSASVDLCYVRSVGVFDGTDEDVPANCFYIVTPKRMWVLAAESSQDANRWVGFIKKEHIPGGSVDNSFDVMEILLNGDVDVLDIILKSTSAELAANLPAICCALHQTPIWLKNQTQIAINAIKKRVNTSACISQCVRFLKQSSPSTFGTLLSDVNTCQDAYNIFLKFKEEKVGEVGDEFEVYIPPDEIVLHPFDYYRVNLIQVEKIFNSNARPLLLNLRTTKAKIENSEVPVLPRDIIYKVGDDLRQDVACLQCFRLMNRIWKQEKLRFENEQVETKVYDCLAMGPDFGVIEYVPHCMPIKKMREIGDLSDSQRARLIATAAGAYTASWLLGIKDRHDDNTLISPEGYLFHIDFGYILGHKVTVDTADFAITKDLRDAIGDNWEEFTRMVMKAFVTLRKHHETVLEYAAMTLGHIFSRETVIKFLRESFLLDIDMGEAALQIVRAVKKAPSSYKTRFKNKVHGIAQKRSDVGKSKSPKESRKRGSAVQISTVL